VEVEARVFAEVSDSTVMSFVSVAEASNFASGDELDVTHDVGWPLVHDLEEPAPFYNGRYGILFGELPVHRGFNVGGGRTPAVAIAVGVVGSIVSGECRFQFGAYSRLFPRSNDGITGLLRYRYDPLEVIQPSFTGAQG
jgi:hypothetical protein